MNIIGGDKEEQHHANELIRLLLVNHPGDIAIYHRAKDPSTNELFVVVVGRGSFAQAMQGELNDVTKIRQMLVKAGRG